MVLPVQLVYLVLLVQLVPPALLVPRVVMGLLVLVPPSAPRAPSPTRYIHYPSLVNPILTYIPHSPPPRFYP